MKSILLLFLLSIVTFTIHCTDEEIEDELTSSIDSIFGKPKVPDLDNTIIDIFNQSVGGIKSNQLKNNSEELGEAEGDCVCVLYYQCTAGNTTNVHGNGIIDVRIGGGRCKTYLEVCCAIPSSVTTTRPIIPPSENINTNTPSHKPNHCGIRNPNGIDFKITGHSHNEAEYGEFPWMTAILKRNYDPLRDETLAICGGAIITPTVIMTGAHCVELYKIGDLKIRAGEWDTQTTSERIPYQERDLVDIIIHPEYYSRALFNDVALLILDRPLEKADTIGTICLPNQRTVFTSRNCFASGWGKNKFEKGQYQAILKKMELPMVYRSQCQSNLRKTRLGTMFELHRSFVCAGGEGNDACSGDGGGPLVCPDPQNPGRYMLAGMVAWGIGCNEHNVPGVYTDVSQFRIWVDQQLYRLQIDTRPYLI